MSNIQFNEKHKNILDTILLPFPIVNPGKMYGHPAYYVGGKLFASVYMEGVCIKIPEARVHELLKKEDIHPFKPIGRKMREWIFLIPKKSEDLKKNLQIFEESIEYVSSIAGINWKKTKQ